MHSDFLKARYNPASGTESSLKEPTTILEFCHDEPPAPTATQGAPLPLEPHLRHWFLNKSFLICYKYQHEDDPCKFETCSRNFISYSKIFLIFGTLRLFVMITNLFVIANVKQLRILLPFSEHLGVLAS